MSNIKNKIVEGIQTAKEQLGITLITEEWGSKQTKCACALGCVLLANNHGLSDDAEQNATEAAEILGVSESWIDNFIRGFDGDSPDEDEPEEAFEIGEEIRKQLNPVNHTDYVESLEPMAVEFMQSVGEVE
jgi:hypothetical protein